MNKLHAALVAGAFAAASTLAVAQTAPTAPAVAASASTTAAPVTTDKDKSKEVAQKPKE